MTIQIIIEDHVVPQLLTSAMEAYEIEHRAHPRGRAKNRLETYGLLWGYALPERGKDLPPRLVAVMATVETSAVRHEDWVAPVIQSLKMKRDFFRQYWPQLELIGTFHSHPYRNLSEIKDCQGWRASQFDEAGNPFGDYVHWPIIHQQCCPNMPHLAHLVVTITALSRLGSAKPTRLTGAEAQTGYILTAEHRKFWIKGYCTEDTEDTEDFDFEDKPDVPKVVVRDDILLDIPSLQQRFA
jgi:hypothetical protein